MMKQGEERAQKGTPELGSSSSPSLEPRVEGVPLQEHRINLNTAGDEELKKVFKSEEVVREIKERRPFVHLDQLRGIKGIDEDLLHELSNVVYVSGTKTGIYGEET